MGVKILHIKIMWDTTKERLKGKFMACDKLRKQ